MARTIFYSSTDLLQTSSYLLSLSPPSSICTLSAMVRLIIHTPPQAPASQHLVSSVIILSVLHVLSKRVLATRLLSSVSTQNKRRTRAAQRSSQFCLPAERSPKLFFNVLSVPNSAASNTNGTFFSYSSDLRI